MGKKKVKSAKKENNGQQALMDKVQKNIDEQVDAASDKLSDEQKMMVKDALKKCFIEGEEPLEAMGLPDYFPELLYKRAYDLYNLGVYEEANSIMRILCMLEPLSARYQLALAATNHQMGNYEIAVNIYIVSFLLDLTSPIPWYYIYDCFMCQDQPGAGHFALRMATDICGERQEFQKFKMKCYRIMNKLNDDYHIMDERAPEIAQSETAAVSEGEAPEGKEEIDIFEELKSRALEEPDL